MIAYYNEFDPFAAAWLRELIKAGAIAPGDVDERSIEDVRPSDLAGYTQCHFFAGIGVWSYALRRAGWADDRPVWTGSCPCQPFSAAGKGGGFSDERHLWPAFHWLIEQCRPPVVLGEQVASKDGLAWLDLVQADLEGTGYASRAVDLCAAGVGAPHIRQRLWWVGERLADADAGGQGMVGSRRDGLRSGQEGDAWSGSGRSGGYVGLADAASGGREPRERNSGIRGTYLGAGPTSEQLGVNRAQGRLDDDDARLEGQRSGHRAALGHGQGTLRPASEAGEPGGLADARREGRREVAGSTLGDEEADGGTGRHGREPDGDHLAASHGADCRPGPTNGLWRDADWLFCRDGKWRPVEPGAQQMADGSTQSLGRLCDSRIRDVEAAVEAWAQRHQRDGTEAVRDLWDVLSQEEAGERTDGGFDSVREAPFLLAFLRQLTDQGWRFPIGDERSSSQASRVSLRVLRYDPSPRYSSRGRGLDEQRPEEPSDALRLLSQIVAHHTEICWGLTGWKDVGSFPLAHGAPARVGRLRGYGNAINAEAAIAFIEAYQDVERLRLTGASLPSPIQSDDGVFG